MVTWMPHLRQIFRKLDIGSRVELARLVTERAPPPAAAGAGRPARPALP